MVIRNFAVALPTRVVERLIAYRRHLRWWQSEGRDRIYSHELAALDGVTPALVRRDLMTIGFTGSPARGYDVAGLIHRISGLLDIGQETGIALIGVGYLGRAILDYFNGRNPDYPIVAAFDIDPEKVGRVIHGCRCYPLNELESVFRERKIRVAIIAVPADVARATAERAVRAGARGLLNFAPVRLHLPREVYAEDVDLGSSLEKVTFFARAGERGPEIEV